MPRTNKLPIRQTPKAPSEHTEQKALFTLARMYRARVPALELLYAIPNGAKLPYTLNAKGQRVSKQARVLLEEGLTAGVPDVCLAVARQGYHGLYIELKKADRSNHASVKQLHMMALLRAEGYRCEVCYGCEAAWATIVDYLGVQL